MLYKKGFSYFGLFFLAFSLFSCRQQENKLADENKTMRIPVLISDSNFLSIDRSPMDMSYFPVDYPKEKMILPDLDNLVARVIYSRPQKNGRTIFADSASTQNSIQQYGKEWRLGANEATEIEFFRNVTIAGKQIPKGRYILYCMPFRDKWKLIFNTNLFSWGLHVDKTKDIDEIELPVNESNTETEFFTMVFQTAPYGCDLVMAWGTIKVIMPVSFR